MNKCIRFKVRLLTFTCLLFSCVLLPNVSVAKTSNEAMDLLNRMRHALHELSYSGTLVFRREDSLTTLHIEHSVINGVKRERVVRLNEQGGEVSREFKGFTLASIPMINPQMEKVYSFDLGRENRVANIPCRIITARPKDRVRYLQKYCIDVNTGMLLDYMLVGKTHKPVEQFMFTSIKFGLPEGETNHAAVSAAPKNQLSESLPLDIELQLNADAPVRLDKQVTPVLSNATSKTIAIVAPAKSTQQISSSELDDGWVMESLPAGFEIMRAPSMKPSLDDDNVTKHYVVTDGLSSLSVFVSPISPTEKIANHAIQVNSGALNVLSRKKDNHLITVVGEVPKSTLKSVVKSLRRTKIK